jgi:hypothetical protein
MLQRITVRKMLIDGRQWGAWQPYLFPVSNEFVTTWTPAGTEMRWATGTFGARFNMLHYWWPGAQYLIGVYYDDTRFAGCYCDVTAPLVPIPADAPAREYLDLYLDLVVRADRSWYTKDQETYDRAEQVIPDLRALRPAAEATLRQMEAWAGAWSGPFARLPLTLSRTDWQTLDPAAPTFAAATSELRAG